jgi:hypothetical protein
MSGSFDCLATHGVLIIISRIRRVVALVSYVNPADH